MNRNALLGILAGASLLGAGCTDDRRGSGGDGVDRINKHQEEAVKREADLKKENAERQSDAMKDQAKALDKQDRDAEADALKKQAKEYEKREKKDAKAMKNAADDAKKVDDDRWGDGVKGKSTKAP